MTGPEGAARCVLIAEENRLSRKLFSAMLTAEGYRVLEADNGPSALDLARQEHPDLIVVDANLSDMAGLEIAHQLKTDQVTRDIPVLLTTDYGVRSDDEAVREAGCDRVMAKPIGVSQFLEIVEAFMIRRAGARPYIV